MDHPKTVKIEPPVPGESPLITNALNHSTSDKSESLGSLDSKELLKHPAPAKQSDVIKLKSQSLERAISESRTHNSELSKSLLPDKLASNDSIHNKLNKIQALLRHSGMDTQQQSKVFEEIKLILGW